jgi:SsrA-binding protein
VKLYLKEGRAKLDIATAKGKKLYDKRHEIAKRDEQREQMRELRKK